MLNMCRPSKPAKRYFLYLRLKIYIITWLLKIWLPPFCVFRAPHFRGIFVVGSSRSWSRGRAPPPPCEAGSGLDQSGLTRHPADLIAWTIGLILSWSLVWKFERKIVEPMPASWVQRYDNTIMMWWVYNDNVIVICWGYDYSISTWMTLSSSCFPWSLLRRFGQPDTWRCFHSNT